MIREIDKYYLDMTLKLAEKGEFTVYPNPKVGAVIVKNNKVVGSGYHKSPGSPHAEAIAIKQAGLKAKSRLETLFDASKGVFTLKSHGVGKFGRVLGEIFIDEVNINNLLIEEGLARKY